MAGKGRGSHVILIAEEEKEKVKQLAIAALWFIQWNPKNRPSMSKVVNMLTGRLQNLQIPPKPFVSTESHSMVTEPYDACGCIGTHLRPMIAKYGKQKRRVTFVSAG
ncbi:hypothetical protein EJB05_56073, partial [Eragrostis curvula]